MTGARGAVCGDGALLSGTLAVRDSNRQPSDYGAASLTARPPLMAVRGTYEFEHVPVEDVVVGEALSVEEVPEELPQVGVVRLVVEAQGATEVQVGGELGCKKTEARMRQDVHTWHLWPVSSRRGGDG
uniref:Uncharacterized protein n=1 Tax=Denticeps clupeoides TaxID=299321 RepID=A0AAY4C7L5_9TELE